MRRIFMLAGSTALATFASLTAPVAAQAPQTARGVALEEIIVTARRREESLQQVPLAISAFTSEELARRGLQDLKDVALFTPGFTFEDFNGALAAPVIRGAAQQSINDLEQNVSTFFDGIYLPRNYVVNLGTGAFSRVEIVKGPQSARYGRNAYMGAINYVPRKPGEEWSGQISGTIGDHKRYEGNGYLGGPIIPGKLGALVTYAYDTYDGTWRNDHPLANAAPKPGTKGNLAGYDRENYSIFLQATPIEALRFEGGYYHYDFKDENSATALFANQGGNTPFGRPNCGARGAGNEQTLYCGTLQDVGQFIVDPRGYGRQTDLDIYRFSASYEILDGLTANYLFGHVKADTGQVGYSDTDARTCPYFVPGACVFQNVPIGDFVFNSHEGRISYNSTDSIFSGSVGIFRSLGRDFNLFNFGLIPPQTTGTLAPLQILDSRFTVLSRTSIRTQDKSVFGEIGVALLDRRLRLGAEVRHTNEDKTQINNVTSARFNSKFKYTTPRFTVEYDVLDKTLAYASVAKGIRTGGFNPTAFLAENRTYRTESNWTYELGVKNDLFDDRVRLNASLFYIDGKDVQISSPDLGNPNQFATNIILNLGNYKAKGFEVELEAQVTEQFSLNGALSYTDANYSSGTIDARFRRVCDNVVCPTSGDISGKQLQRQSPWKASVGAQWADVLPFGGGDWRYFVRGDLGYSSSQYGESMNLSRIAARTVVNASLGIGNEWLDLRLWSKNLFNKKYVSAAFVTITNTGGSYAPVMGEKRTVGLTATLRY
jgi:iron complex outermembrane receptor protein